jgi:high-affinity nickel-transport protein
MFARIMVARMDRHSAAMQHARDMRKPTMHRILARKVVPLVALLLLANAAAWAWAWTAFADRPVLLGTALLAWVFGLRHAVDADHIAAIDNVVRRQMQAGGRPISVGLWFSLGHATVVVLASLALVLTAATLQDRLAYAQALGGVVGPAVSALFLLAVAVANLLILRGTWRSFRRVHQGVAVRDDHIFDGGATGVPFGGLLTRLLGPLLRAVTRPWQMYPVGFLFGLGFDTATEIGLLGIAASQAAQGLSPWQTMVFPALFTVGMALVDTTDSVLMVGAYGWAFVDPLRKLWYNLTITAASVIVALLIGGIEALGLLADRLGLEGGIWKLITGLNDDLSIFGVAVIGVFVLCWVVSAAVYRVKGYGKVPARG